MGINKTVLILCVMLFIALWSCENKSGMPAVGNASEVKLKKNEIAIDATWRAADNELWILSKDTITNIKYFRKYYAPAFRWGNEIIIK
jgi:hypothetical protein